VEIDAGSLRGLDDAQRYSYRRVAPDQAAGKARGWLDKKQYHYRATVRRVDQSEARIDQISQDVRSELSQAGWQWLKPSGPSSVAAVDFLPFGWLSRPAIQIVLKDHVGTDYSAAGSASFEEMLAEDLRTAGYRLGSGNDALTLEVEIVKYEPGSRVKRFILSDLRFIGFPAFGASRLVYEATVLDASGNVLGRTEGRKRYTGTEIIDDNPELMSALQIREGMASHCATQIGEYMQTLAIGR
jgi:hypothetical protein